MIKSFLQRLAIKYLDLQDLSAVPTAPAVAPSVRVVSKGDVADASDKATLDIKIDPLVKVQLEAERCIQAMQSMVDHYNRNNGEVDALFCQSCVMMMTTAQGTVQRLYQFCEQSKT